MTGLKKSLTVFLIIFFQTILATASGLAVFYFLTRDGIPPNVYIDSVAVGGLKKDEAVAKLKLHYGETLKTEKLVIKFNNDGIEDFEIGFDEIGGAIDCNSTIEAALGSGGGNSLAGIFACIVKGYYTSSKKYFNPVITFDETKLREKLKHLSVRLYKEPSNANIYLKDGRVVKIPGVNGVSLNIDNSVKKIREALSSNYKSPVLFDPENDFEIETIEPAIKTQDLEGADEIISRYSTEIKSAENLDSIKKAVSAINRVLVFPADANTGKSAGVFSFNKYLAAANALKEQNDEGYNQVASTLHAAVLFAGIDPAGITRIKHRSVVDYIDPGLDVRVFGTVEDFKFRNSLDSIVVIFAEIVDNKVVVSIVGKKKDMVENDVSIEIEQKIQPSVVNVENHDLEPGESKLVSPGKAGLKVKVYKTVIKNGGEKDKTLVYSDEYQPVEAIVQVGRSFVPEGRGVVK